ncbi:c-type cytochrome [Sphingomonas sp. BK580]|uniref:c-type cytochrome n=1 Tax=Sphingomonas sp. BK580 TaxID=2586972 RepID=UPI0016109EB1|nr:cytochrome c [Sphingomonas sp. BK580]MBB3694287.1 mono/diheme cytochrome c family protein [Sphingomonas sp. BK580]
MTHPSLRPLLAVALVALPAVALSQAAPRSVWGGVYTAAQVQRGAAVYAAHCASCHGDALGGNDQAPALAGSGFLANWNGQSAAALFTRIKTTMPFDNPNSLGAAKVADVEAMILSKNGFPAGAAELPSDAGALGTIAITQDKPGA